MKNLHKVVLSIMVGVLAIAFSAFTTAKKVAAVTFYQTSADQYQKIDDTGDCNGANATHACSITYATDPGVTSFTWAARPSGGTASSINKLYVP